MKESENVPQVFEDDSIDLITLLRKLYLSRRLILKVTGTAALLGIVIALSTPNTYTSVTTFIPQTGGNPGNSSSLSGLASLAGINIGGASAGENIPTNLYPQIISSIPYKKSLLKENIIVGNNLISVSEYLTSKTGREISLIGIIKKYTIGLPRLINSMFEGPVDEAIASKDKSVYLTTNEDRKLFGIIDSNLLLTLNIQDGIVTLEFSDSDRFVAAGIAERAKELLQDFIIDFKNKSAREQLNFVIGQYQENKIIYERLQDSLAIFKDENLNISSLFYQNRLDRLERELNIASSVAEQLASQVEQAKLQVNKDTPVFTTIEPVTVPPGPSAPKRKRLVMIWAFLGLALSIVFVLVREPTTEILQLIKKVDS